MLADKMNVTLAIKKNEDFHVPSSLPQGFPLPLNPSNWTPQLESPGQSPSLPTSIP